MPREGTGLAAASVENGGCSVTLVQPSFLHQLSLRLSRMACEDGSSIGTTWDLLAAEYFPFLYQESLNIKVQTFF